MENIIILDEVTSTNAYLKQYYRQLPSDVVVIAKQQSKGKGRMDRTWKSDAGNLYLSILKKDVKREQVFIELMNVSVSVVMLLKEYGIQSSIKYPNDIIVGTKKICGILMESIGFDVMDYLIIGIGININQSDFQELSDKATSVFIETNSQEEVIPLSKRFLDLVQKEKDVYKEYVIHSYVIGKQIHYQGMLYTISSINLDGSVKLSGFKEINIPLNEISLEELYE